MHISTSFYPRYMYRYMYKFVIFIMAYCMIKQLCCCYCIGLNNPSKYSTKIEHSAWGNGSFQPRVVSALSRFGPWSFRPGSSRPRSIRPWVVSAYFFSTVRLVTEGQLNTLKAS